MLARKAAVIAAGVFLAPAALAQHHRESSLHVRLDLPRVGIVIAGPRHAPPPMPVCEPPRRAPRHHAPPPPPQYPCEQEVRLHLDGRPITATVRLERQPCGTLVARVRLDTCDRRGLPRLERASLHLVVDGRDWCIDLCPKAAHGRQSATLIAQDGPRVRPGATASARLTLETRRDSDSARIHRLSVR
jgi:hypothetical protein